MKEFLVYTGLRLALFVASLAIIVGIWTLASADGGVPIVWAVVIAFVVSGIASYFMLNAYRERFARVVSARAERAAARFEERRAAEDAADASAGSTTASPDDAADNADAALPPEDRRP